MNINKSNYKALISNNIFPTVNFKRLKINEQKLFTTLHEIFQLVADMQTCPRVIACRRFNKILVGHLKRHADILSTSKWKGLSQLFVNMLYVSHALTSRITEMTRTCACNFQSYKNWIIVRKKKMATTYENKKNLPDKNIETKIINLICAM